MFKELKIKVDQAIKDMSDKDLFVVDLEKNVLINAYLECFKGVETKQYHNCNCCKSFLRNYGGLVAIEDNKVRTIWQDIKLEGVYSKVPRVLHNLVSNAQISKPFFTNEAELGTDFNIKILDETNNIRYEHLSSTAPVNVIKCKEGINTLIGNTITTKDMFKRTLETITLDSIETVLELVAQNSLYRGQEHTNLLTLLKEQLNIYKELSSKERDLYIWKKSSIARIRNSSIGTLLVDLSEGVSLDVAVKKFEAMVAPNNYKRPKALVTPKMIKLAEAKVTKLGFTEGLARRHATIDDIPIENVVFADRSVRERGLFVELKEDILVNSKTFSKVEEVEIDKFLSEIVPTATSLEVLLESKHSGNLVNILESQNKNSKKLFTWSNGISWCYKDNVTDSMKELVKQKGGKVDGVLRFSIRWNDEGEDRNTDFDAHCVEPDGNRIYFQNKYPTIHTSSGMLDVDIMTPESKVAVENIVWTDEDKMQEGKYSFVVHNYSGFTSKAGFSAEIEYRGKLHTYEHEGCLKGNEKVTIDTGILYKKKEFILEGSSKKLTSKEIYNLGTNKFHKVNIIMLSPNHWEKVKGNKHVFFLIEETRTEEPCRGIFNEFLVPELYESRKVFEVLGEKTKVSPEGEQLAGLGFSSTQRASVLCRVKGKFGRIIKINF